MRVDGQRHGPAALPSRKTRYPLYRRLGGSQSPPGQVRNISPPPGFDPRIVQPVVSRYTDYAILATFLACRFLLLISSLSLFLLTRVFSSFLPFPHFYNVITTRRSETIMTFGEMKENTNDLPALIKRHCIIAFRLPIAAVRKVILRQAVGLAVRQAESRPQIDRQGSEDKVSAEWRLSGTWRAALVHICQINRYHLCLKRKL